MECVTRLITCFRDKLKISSNNTLPAPIRLLWTGAGSLASARMKPLA